MQITDVLTVSGAAVIVLILVGAIKSAFTSFDASRFGALVSIILGIVIVALANATSVVVHLDWGTAIITGILAGASASGLYDAGLGINKARSA